METETTEKQYPSKPDLAEDNQTNRNVEPDGSIRPLRDNGFRFTTTGNLEPASYSPLFPRFQRRPKPPNIVIPRGKPSYRRDSSLSKHFVIATVPTICGPFLGTLTIDDKKGKPFHFPNRLAPSLDTPKPSIKRPRLCQIEEFVFVSGESIGKCLGVFQDGRPCTFAYGQELLPQPERSHTNTNAQFNCKEHGPTTSTAHSIFCGHGTRPTSWKRDLPSQNLSSLSLNHEDKEKEKSRIAYIWERYVRVRSNPYTELVIGIMRNFANLAAYADALSDADRIIRRKTPRPPCESDPVGFLPRELKFNQYLFNMHSPARTPAAIKRGFKGGVPRSCFADLTSAAPQLEFTDFLSALSDAGDAATIRSLSNLDTLLSIEFEIPEALTSDCGSESEHTDTQEETHTAELRKAHLPKLQREMLQVCRCLQDGLTQAQTGRKTQLSEDQVQRRFTQVKKLIGAATIKNATLNESEDCPRSARNLRSSEHALPKEVRQSAAPQFFRSNSNGIRVNRRSSRANRKARIYGLE